MGCNSGFNVMRIVICNKFFFVSGGTDRYMFELMDELRAKGHTPIPFSIKHAISKPSEYDKYFLPPPAPPDQVFFSQIRLSNANLIRLLDRSFYSLEAQTYLNRLILKESPIDIAYILNIYNYMSPSIIRTFKKHGIPVVQMLGDYHLQCPSYLLLRKGKPCSLCVEHQYYHALKYRCLKNNFFVTLIRVIAMYLYRRLGIYDMVDAFVVPCNFMRDILIRGGYSPHKIRLIKYPVREINLNELNGFTKDYILYFGRISYEKGLDLLINAYQKIAHLYDVKLVILGRDYDGEKSRLLSLIKPGMEERILFPGFAEGKELSKWIMGAVFTVVPSRWYDNAPLSVYESYLHEVPVVGARIGGITEQIEDTVTGRLFEPESVTDLAKVMEWMLADKSRLTHMGKMGKQKVLTENNYEVHTSSLLKLFEELLS